jgi:hypothetical protein
MAEQNNAKLVLNIGDKFRHYKVTGDLDIEVLKVYTIENDPVDTLWATVRRIKKPDMIEEFPRLIIEDFWEKIVEEPNKKFDESELALHICEQISQKCGGHKVQVTEPYIDPVDGEPIYRRSIYIDGLPASVSLPGADNENVGQDYYDGFVDSVVEQINKQYQ